MKFWANLWPLVREALRDALCIGGIALIGYGVHQMYPPAAFIVVGIIILALGLLGSVK